jgi:(1->4)-alpha-D-glucan 1-alpha-D-glucosylmutase
VGGDDNQWWMDVLENGQTSVYAAYFDIDWFPPKDDLRGKVLSPVLGDHYGKLLENGDIKLVFEAEEGSFAVRYYNHRFPLDPQTYPLVLHHDITRLESMLGAEDSRLLDFQSLITALQNLPARSERSEPRIKERRRDKEVHKRRLAHLARDHAEIRRFIEENISTLNGISGDPSSFNLLHGLLEAQAYRLANWRVASDEINYRRFFDVNHLAGLRTENPEVFESTHRLIFELIATDKVDGLRIDHPDGLYDPAEYYGRLQRRLVELTANVNPPPKEDEPASQVPAMYVIAEKILASHERIPEGWSVHGTTGYEFANLVNGVFVYAPAERDMDRIYRRFSGVQPDFEDMLYDCKKLVMRTALSSELHVLANYLDRISETDRYTRDYTRTAQRSALFEVVACFPVYRTYVSAERITEEDRRYVDWAIATAKRRNPAADITIYDFIRRILLLEDLHDRDPSYRNAVVEFVMRFQQYTAPVMAKGLEDTLFYRQNRLTSLNEVGGDPRGFAVSIPAFHFANQERQRRWPFSMLCTSSHDTKRSEDVRARINVLSELSGEWRMHLSRWNRINRGKKRQVGESTAPSQNDEYLLYQTLLGVWPSGPLDAATLQCLHDRVSAYMRKAIREAKVHTSWINPNLEYEEAVDAFVQALLQTRERNLFLDDFLPFQHRVAGFGQLNGLSQAVLKLTSPGVPDIYQGTELYDLSLVDPDNRRPVDYAARRKILDALRVLPEQSVKNRALQTRALLNHLEDGRAKLYLTWLALNLRRDNPELFTRGDYLGLDVKGGRAEHICAYARNTPQRTAIIVAPRWFSRLISDAEGAELFEADVWTDTYVELPDLLLRSYRDLLTGEQISPVINRDRARLKVKDLLKNFPVAILIS